MDKFNATSIPAGATVDDIELKSSCDEAAAH